MNRAYILKTGLCPLNYEDSCHGEDEYIYWTHEDCGERGLVDVDPEVK